MTADGSPQPAPDQRRARRLVAVVSVVAVAVALLWVLVPGRAHRADLHAQGQLLYSAPANGDQMYYASMALQFTGVPYAESLKRTADYYDYPGDWRLLRFNNPDISTLVYPRTVLPLLATPFIPSMDLAAMFVPGIALGLLTLLLVVVAARRWGALYAVGPPILLFVLTPGFSEIGTGLYTESILMAVSIATVLCLPLRRPRVGWPELAWLATLTIVAGLTRQAAPIVALTALGGLLGVMIRPSGPRRDVLRAWAAPVGVSVVVGAITTLLVMRWAPYDPLAMTRQLQGGSSTVGALLRGLVTLPGTFVHEATANQWGVLPWLWVVLSLAALVVLLVTDPLGWVVLGAAAFPVATAALNNLAVTRYLSPCYPLLVLAQAVVLHRLLLRWDRYAQLVDGVVGRVAPAPLPDVPEALDAVDADVDETASQLEEEPVPAAPEPRRQLPTLLWGSTALAVAVVLVAATCGVYQSAPTSQVVHLTKADLGRHWPFTVASVDVECAGDDGQLRVLSGGRTYALSGTAMARRAPWTPVASQLRSASTSAWAAQSSALVAKVYAECPIPGLAPAGSAHA